MMFVAGLRLMQAWIWWFSSTSRSSSASTGWAVGLCRGRCKGAHVRRAVVRKPGPRCEGGHALIIGSADREAQAEDAGFEPAASWWAGADYAPKTCAAYQRPSELWT